MSIRKYPLLRFFIAGAFLGGAFPLIAFSFLEHPKFLFGLICTAPFVLSFFSYFLGKSKVGELNLTEQAEAISGMLMQLEEAQQIANVGSWEFHSMSKNLIWSKQLFKIFHIDENTPNSQLFEKYSERIYPDDRERLFDLVEVAMATSTGYTIDHRILLDDGSIKFIRGIAEVKFNQEIDEIVLTGTAQDITELKEKDDLLAEAQSISKIGSWQFDLSNQRQIWSSEHYKIFEIEEPQPQEALYSLYREKIHPDDLAMLDDCITRAVQFGQDFTFNHRVVLDGGARIKHVQGIGRVIKDKVGRPVKISGTCRDRTAEVEMENILQQERAVSAHTAKLATLGEMSAGVAHEINNPLAIIYGNLSILNKIKNDSEKFENRIDSMTKAVERIAHIVSGLRKFSRTEESNKREVEVFSDLIREALILTAAKSKRLSIPIEINILSSSTVECDEVEIVQVLASLINNALYAASECSTPWVKINLFDSGDYIVFQVIDSGLGISKDIEKKLFQPFFTTKPIGKGTGLGLSVAKGVLDQHNAKISINRLVENTCFEVQFIRTNAQKFVA